MAAIFQPCSFWFGQKKSHSLLEITLKQRVHPELWLAEFHPTSVLLGDKNGITLLCSCFLSTGHDMMLTLSLDIQGWFFVENFKDICQLWLDFRHYWRYMYLVRYIGSLCRTGGPINGRILDGLLCLLW